MSNAPYALGLDAGGTQTRWALADASGRLCGEGTVGGLSGLQLDHAAGRADVAATLAQIAAQAGPVQAVVAGMTGFDDEQAPLLQQLMAQAFATPVGTPHARAMNDIELICRAAFAPGQGLVLYAGTGTVAAGFDGEGRLQRAGGRGAVIDDAGGGHWIAREALRQVWRAEDSEPGAWRASPLAQRVFERIGAADWALTRQWVYGASRGELGTLALAVAAAADEDAVALHILRAAGRELARLPQALSRRLGARPLALAGRVFELHPAVEAALREALPPGTPLSRLDTPPHHAAALLAAHRITA